MTCSLCGAAGPDGGCGQCAGNPSLAQLVKANPSLAAGLREVADRIRADEKIMAIKRLRELLPIGLKEAKDVIDDVHHGAVQAPRDRADLVSMAAEVIVLIRAGQKIQAIKVVREAQGVGLKEAKDIVEEMEAKMVAERAVPPSPAIPPGRVEPVAVGHTAPPMPAIGVQAAVPASSVPAQRGSSPRHGPIPISGEETGGSPLRFVFAIAVLAAAAAGAHAMGWF